MARYYVQPVYEIPNFKDLVAEYSDLREARKAYQRRMLASPAATIRDVNALREYRAMTARYREVNRELDRLRKYGIPHVMDRARDHVQRAGDPIVAIGFRIVRNRT